MAKAAKATDGRTVWLVPGLRTPFTKVDGALAKRDALALGVPVLQAMAGQLKSGSRIDFGIWGTVAPSIRCSNIARETWLDAGLDPTVPTASVVMACSTSMMATIEAAGIVSRGDGDLALAGGVESMTHVQLGISQPLSDSLRRLSSARDFKQRAAVIGAVKAKDVRLQIPSLQNRITKKSMGEHCELMAQEWEIGRQPQDELAFRSHKNATNAQKRGFFKDLIAPVDGVDRDTFPRESTSVEALAKLKPAFDRKSGKGTLTAGNSSPLTDGAAGLWVASDAGLARLPSSLPKVKYVDAELGAVDILKEGLLMAPAYAIPRLLKRNGLTCGDIGLWEIHEAFAAQVLCTIKALETPAFLKEKVGIDGGFGPFPHDRVNPNGGSVALGHPFGATGARILSQAARALAAMPSGTKAIVSICADGGLGTVALLEAA